MTSFLTNDLARYLPRHAIPLYVEEVASGAHPALKFHGHTFMELVLIQNGQGNLLVRISPKHMSCRKKKKHLQGSIQLKFERKIYS